MREELAEKIIMMLMRHDVNDESIKSDLTILLNDYEITSRETAVAVRSEDRNRWYLEKFLVAKTVRGCTDKTLEQYKRVLEKILSVINKPANEITTDDIRYYLALRDRRDKVTKTTQNNELRYMRTFFQYLTNEELIVRDPTAKIDSIKAAKKKKDAFTEIEVEKIRAGCANTKERMIVEVLLSTGCRVTELCQIMISDITGASLTVHGKGNKDRTVYLNAKAQLAIEAYLKERQDNNPYLLPKMAPITKIDRHKLRSAYKYAENIEPGGHMDKSGVEWVMRRISNRCGVANVHPHRFRRTCATFALRRGMPIEQVSKMLGHEQINTTQIYLDLDEKDLEQAHRKYVV